MTHNITSKMKKYASVFRIRFINGLQYRIAALAGIATQFAWGGLTLLLYEAFFRADPSSMPMERGQLSSYIWLQQGFLAVFMLWNFDKTIFEQITSGNVAYELCRPMDLYSHWFAKNLATRAANAFLRCVPVFLVASLLPYGYSLGLPASLPAFLIFLVSFALGFAVVVAMCMLVYIMTFYTLDSMGLRIIVSSVSEFLSGAVIPIPFFPESLQKILYLLPFASSQSTPLLVYVGVYDTYASLRAVTLQLAWLVILVLLGRALMSRALTKVVVQGG